MNVDHVTVERFAESLRSRGKQPSTVESYCRDAQRFLDYLSQNRLAPTKVEAQTLLSYREHLVDKAKEKNNSVRRTIIGVRQFYRFLSDQNHLSETPFDAVPIPERKDILPDNLKRENIEGLIATATKNANTLIGARNAVIVALLAYDGLKATELIDLRWSAYLAGAQASLRIPGTRQRTIQLSPESAELLAAYRRRYLEFQNHPAIAAAKEKKIFIAFRGRDASIPIALMTRHGLKFIVYELGERVGIKHLNTELLRHFAVTHLLSQGRSAEEIMSHLGLRRLGNIAKHMASSPSSGTTGATPRS